MTKNLSIAIQAALNAGAEILKIYQTNFEVEIKNDNSPLTIADKKANEVIMDFLRPTNIPIISEENKQQPYEVRKHWQQCWIVDPLDGTKEFIKRNGEFTVNIALIENGSPILGVIYIPVSKTLYFTSAEKPTSKKIVLTSTNTSVETILQTATAIQSAKPTSKIIIATSRSHLNQATKNYIATINAKREVEVIARGSSLKFCLIAEGLVHIYPRFAPTMEWDTAAGQAICNAVGVRVIDITTAKPMQYNKPNLLNNNFMVSTV
ncbi:3'(2'),5'-bisphosphate nucleotidase CysQ [Aequorivita flava]|uniref:3'(2'),5'-bisphosphate nucleotidase CysQ n=1 Tax=Aequorivita flava TaxID=3114371 RepID=A0AB35Z004_9FLAO